MVEVDVIFRDQSGRVLREACLPHVPAYNDVISIQDEGEFKVYRVHWFIDYGKTGNASAHVYLERS